MITYRSATNEDIQAVVTLVNSAYRGETSKKGWTTEADLLDGQRTDPEKIQEMIESPESRIELAIDEQDEIFACIYLRREIGFLYIGMLAVKPELQARGTGKKLLKKMEDVAKECHLPEIRMTVIEQRPDLIAYYERRGFQRTGKTEPFPENDPRFGIPKVRGLMFHEFKKKI